MVPLKFTQGIGKKSVWLVYSVLFIIFGLVAVIVVFKNQEQTYNFDIRSAPSIATGFIRAEGTFLIGPSGEPFRIKGYNLPDWLQVEDWLLAGYGSRLGGVGHEPSIRNFLNSEIQDGYGNIFYQGLRDNFYTKEDISLLIESGANTLRLPVSHWMIDGTYDGYTYIDQLISWAHELNFFIMLDLHTTPGCQNSSNYCNPSLTSTEAPFFENEEYRLTTTELWRALAYRYRNESKIAGFNLINEPNNFPHSVEDGKILLEFYFDTIKAIRSVDAHHLIVLDGDKWATELDVFKVDNVTLSKYDNNFALSFHDYTVSNCGLLDNVVPVLAKKMKTHQLRKKLTLLIKVVSDQKVPVIVGEYGAFCVSSQQAYHEVFEELHLEHTFYYSPIGIFNKNENGMIVYRFDALPWISYLKQLQNSKQPSEDTMKEAFKSIRDKELYADKERVVDFANFFNGAN